MEIGLWNLEPELDNTAMMQVSQYHKQQDDEVRIYDRFSYPIYDRIYLFSLFDFTPKPKIYPKMIYGGTGFDVKIKLPKEIEDSDLDYSIFPRCDASYIWFSRGCIRYCPFCVIREKEGYIHSVTPKNLNPKGKWINVMDNNFFANSEWRNAIKWLKTQNQPVSIQQGIDVRLINEEQCMALNSLKHHKQIKIAWDNPKEDLVPKIKEMLRYIKPYKIMCYVLIGYNSTEKEDLYRVEELRKLKIDPFVMSYNKLDRYQKDFARWVNRKEIFKTCTWGDYGN